MDFYCIEREQKLRERELAFQERQKIYHGKLRKEKNGGKTSKVIRQTIPDNSLERV